MLNKYRKYEQLKFLLEYQKKSKQTLRELTHQYNILMEYFYSTKSPNEANDKLYMEELDGAENEVRFATTYISLFDRVKTNKRKRFCVAKDLKNIKLEIQTLYKNYNEKDN